MANQPTNPARAAAEEIFNFNMSYEVREDELVNEWTAIIAKHFPAPTVTQDENGEHQIAPHKVMTLAEYEADNILGWHSVCYNYDGCGNVAIRYHAAPTVTQPPLSVAIEKVKRIRDDYIACAASMQDDEQIGIFSGNAAVAHEILAELTKLAAAPEGGEEKYD